MSAVCCPFCPPLPAAHPSKRESAQQLVSDGWERCVYMRTLERKAVSAIHSLEQQAGLPGKKKKIRMGVSSTEPKLRFFFFFFFFSLPSRPFLSVVAAKTSRGCKKSSLSRDSPPRHMLRLRRYLIPRRKGGHVDKRAVSQK